MAKQQFFLNGRRYSHSSLEITILRQNKTSEIFIDIDSIDYGEELDIALVRGTNRGMIGWTAGDYTADDATLSMGKSTFQFGIVTAIGNGWLGTDISVTISYNDVGEPLTTDVLKGRILSAKDSSTAGPENNKTKMGIKCAWISRNGIFPLANMVV